MASHALNHTDIQANEFPIKTNFRSLSEWASSLSQAPRFTEEMGEREISAASGFKGAKAAMVAIGLEAAAAACIYGIWQIWQILR
jgi:hypothetical protein